MATVEIRISHPAISGFLGYMDPDTLTGSDEEMARSYARLLPTECERMLKELATFFDGAEFPLGEIQNIYNRNLKSADEAKDWLSKMAAVMRDEQAEKNRINVSMHHPN